MCHFCSSSVANRWMDDSSTWRSTSHGQHKGSRLSRTELKVPHAYRWRLGFSPHPASLSAWSRVPSSAWSQAGRSCRPGSYGAASQLRTNKWVTGAFQPKENLTQPFGRSEKGLMLAQGLRSWAMSTLRPVSKNNGGSDLHVKAGRDNNWSAVFGHYVSNECSDTNPQIICETAFLIDPAGSANQLHRKMCTVIRRKSDRDRRPGGG